MKPFFPAVVALIVGIVLGAWQPRGELLAMRAELDELRAEGNKPCRTSAAQSIRSILRADTPDIEAAAGDPAPPSEPAPADEQPAEGQAPSPDEPAAEVPRTPEEVQAAMRTALDARRAQAMAALVEQGDLDDDEIEAVNEAMDEMNRALKAQVERFVAEQVSDGEIDRRDLADFAADALEVYISADDGMRDALPPEVYDAADDSAVDPLSYVSGDTLDALVRLGGVDAPVFDR